MKRIIVGIVETTTLLALNGPTGDEVADIDHVTQFTDVLAGFHTLEQGFGLFVQQVETVPGSLQAQVAAYDADIIGHDLTDFLDTLRDEHMLLVGKGALIIPFGNAGVVGLFIDMLQGMTGSGFGINDGFNQRVGS